MVTLMKKDIIDRYERNDDGLIIIDVSASKVEELYEDFDKQAPYHRKDLDEELAAWLTDCVREIGTADFVVRITLDLLPSTAMQERIRTSLRKFFIYQKELEMRSIGRMVKRSLVFLVTGIVLLFLSGRMSSFIPQSAIHSPYFRVLAEGVTIAAWVSLWESLSIFLVNWWPSRQRIRLNSRIVGAEVTFQSSAVRV
jgi:hypothetical protein